MPCCVPTVIEFVNVPSTVIPYTPFMKAKYGSMPKVQVAYLDPDTGEFYLSGFFTRVSYSASTITVDHGGENTGVITIT
jgi:hypothetical protein